MRGSNILLVTNGPESAELWERLDIRGAKFVHISALSLSLTEDEYPYADLVLLADDNSRSEELDLCRRLRARFSAPILVLTRHSDEGAVVALYGAGADECMARSISRALLHAKLHAWLCWVRRKAHAVHTDGSASSVLTARTSHNTTS